jgi:hypothetical protein
MEPVDPKNPKERPPWRPRVDSEPELNPSVRTTEPAGSELTLEETEDEADESEARENDPEPIKTHKKP